MKRSGWIKLLFVGMIPFGIVICYGLYSFFVGSSGLCIKNCYQVNGFEKFMDNVILYSYVYWPTYIIGIILIVISVMNLMKEK